MNRTTFRALLLALLLATPWPVANGAFAAGDVTEHPDLLYRTIDGVTLALDAYLPAGGPHPALLLIHGGGWDHGDKSHETALARDLAGHGYAVFAVDYRLAPKGGTWHYPAPLEDLRAALTWIRANAASYDVDPARVGVFGDSAGANLALMLGVTGTPGADRAEVVVSWSGPTDFTTLADTNGSFANYLGCSLQACPQTWKNASPISHVSANAAPVFLANSAGEFIDPTQATTYAAALAHAGVPTEVLILPGARHAKQYLADALAPSLAFLDTYLAGNPPAAG